MSENGQTVIPTRDVWQPGENRREWRGVRPATTAGGDTVGHGLGTIGVMCRNIRPLHNFEPPATGAEVHDAALQFVRKVSGSSRPSAANQEVFDRAVATIAAATQEMLDSLVTTAPPKDREIEAAKARARAAKRYGAT